VILRRRGDYARVLRELGGALFATEGQVDRYFNHANEKCKKIYEQYRAGLALVPDVDFLNMEWFKNYDVDLERVKSRVVEHVRTAPDREREALRRANIRQTRRDE